MAGHSRSKNGVASLAEVFVIASEAKQSRPEIASAAFGCLAMTGENARYMRNSSPR
jgi:hypothetical protein